MLFEALSSTRDLGRVREIATVLVRHGLGDLVRRLGLARILRRAGVALHWKGAASAVELDPQERVRLALEELGPAFVKVGQLLAGRTDLLPPAWTQELSRLQERASPSPADAVMTQLEEDLGAPVGEVFAEFESEPVAAASIAQVHRARLPDGTVVAIKIRRPGIRAVVESDLRLLARMAARIEALVPELGRYRPRQLVRQFQRSLRAELDLRLEARNAAELAANLAQFEGLVVPRVHERWSGERLCVMDFLPGPSVGAWLRAGGGPEAPAIARTGADAVLHMVFVDGFFHADPHPGNVLVLGGGRIGLLDFGMVGRLSDTRRLEFLELLNAIVAGRIDDVADMLREWSLDGSSAHPDLVGDCADFVQRHANLPLSELDVRAILLDIATILRENDLYLPEDVALLLKVFVTLETLGRALDPSFVMTEHVAPFAREALREARSPRALMGRGARELGGLLRGLPRDVRRLRSVLRRGVVKVEVDVVELERVADRLDRSSRNVAIGMVTAALIVGTSIAMTGSAGPRTFGFPLVGLLGFSSSILAGLWLIVSFRR